MTVTVILCSDRPKPKCMHVTVSFWSTTLRRLRGRVDFHPNYQRVTMKIYPEIQHRVPIHPRNHPMNMIQCTVLWHRGDIKLSHKYTCVITDLIWILNKDHRNNFPLSVTRGKVHDYLGITIDFSVYWKVMIIIIDYIKKTPADLSNDIYSEKGTPASNHLFTVNSEDPILLDEPKKVVFHHSTSKLLFLLKLGCMDGQTATSFLCTCIKQPYTYGYKKLGHIMKYLRATVNFPFIPWAHGSDNIYWY